MTRLILLRHGESEANAKGILAGQTDFELTEKGRQQASEAAAFLATHESIDHIWSSDLSRAVDTAKPTADLLELSIHTDSRLREVDTGSWAGLSREERCARYPELSEEFKQNPSQFRYPDGESCPEVYDRVVEVIGEIAEQYPNECVLIVSHAGAIARFEAFAAGYSREESFGVVEPSKNAAIHIYEWSNGKAELRARNITDHLSEGSESETEN